MLLPGISLIKKSVDFKIIINATNRPDSKAHVKIEVNLKLSATYRYSSRAVWV